MSSGRELTPQSEIYYVVSWFKEWSEMQKQDFLPIISQKYAPAHYMNGLLGAMDSLETNGRPPSIFKCQIKLFHEWFDTWSQAERGHFLERLREIDAPFIGLFDDEMSKLEKPNTPSDHDSTEDANKSFEAHEEYFQQEHDSVSEEQELSQDEEEVERL